jgi:DNA-binding response OmpR family regulator
MPERISVLIIDDDADLRQLFEDALSMAGFDVRHAPDGQTGLDLAQKQPPTLILLDVTMEPMSGLEVLSQLKSDDKTRQIPVFMLTGKSGSDEIALALKIGAADYLTKPVELMKLAPILRQKLARCSPRPK